MSTSDDPAVAVCFDMDGVLVDSEDYWHHAERDEIFPTAFVGDPPEPSEVQGLYYPEKYDVLADEYETAVSKAEFCRLYESAATTVYSEQVQLLSGTHETLAALDERGLRTAVVSSSPVDWIDTVLDRFELPFDDVYSVDEFDGPGKPEPGVYETAIADLGATPETTLVIEDSANGVRAAARAGATVIAFRREHNAEADLSPADIVVESPDELHERVRTTVDELIAGESASD